MQGANSLPDGHAQDHRDRCVDLCPVSLVLLPSIHLFSLLPKPPSYLPRSSPDPPSHPPFHLTHLCRRYNTGLYAPTHTPAHTIRMAHPVWRTRHLPFGHGVLSLPQCGGTGLGMYVFGEQASFSLVFRLFLLFSSEMELILISLWRRPLPRTLPC
jgi:hypothetical protein